MMSAVNKLKRSYGADSFQWFIRTCFPWYFCKAFDFGRIHLIYFNNINSFVEVTCIVENFKWMMNIQQFHKK